MEYVMKVEHLFLSSRVLFLQLLNSDKGGDGLSVVVGSSEKRLESAHYPGYTFLRTFFVGILNGGCTISSPLCTQKTFDVVNETFHEV